jgi:ArsR family transcriptional regulator
MRKAKVDINNEKLQISSEVLRAVAHPLRLKILEFIDQNDMINVNKIYNSLNLEQSITSQHLRILRMAGLVETKRDGKFIHYSVDYDKVIATVNAVNEFLEESR